jgi:hypothetical protein
MQMNSLVYEGHTITIRDDGWFNATQAASHWGKFPAEWLRLPGTISYIEAFKRKYGDIPYLQTKRGASGGTLMHPKLAVPFARWLDDDFAVWCDGQIDDIIRGKQDWSRMRHISAASAKLLHAMIKECREASGKDVKGHHFMAEHKLVNSLLTGKYEGLNRDCLVGWQLDFIGHFDLRDSILIARGASYDERKSTLQAEALAWKVANAHRIEAANSALQLAA